MRCEIFGRREVGGGRQRSGNVPLQSEIRSPVHVVRFFGKSHFFTSRGLRGRCLCILR